MALEFIKGQGIEFIRSGETDFNTRNYNCKGDPRQFCQVVHKDYQTQFQLKMLRTDEDNLLSNPEFSPNLVSWTPAVPSGTWAWDAGLGTGAAVGGATGGQTVSLYQQSVAVTAGVTYEIIVTLAALNLGPYFYVGADSTGSDPVGTFTGYGSSSNPIENTSGSAYTEPQTFNIYYTAGYTGNIDFYIRLVNGLGGAVTRSVTVDSVFMYPTQQPTVSITDCDGNVVTEEVDTFEVVGDYVTVTVDWTPYPAGCYRICVYPDDDPSENILGAALCLTDEMGQPITDEHGNCIEIIP